MIGLIDSWDVEYNGTENEARFQLVCDSASELSSLTHYDSIKIRIGSECTDIATGDKYLKSSTAWILQPSANQFENVYTKAQVDSMYSTLYQTMLYYHTTQTSTDGTITFYAFAGFVGSLTIYGNGQQTGTPTPDNPVMPEFVGTLDGTDWTIPITCASQTTPLYLGEVSTTRRIKKLVMDGTEEWALVGVDYIHGLYIEQPPIGNYEAQICSHYAHVNNWSELQSTNNSFGISSQKRIVIHDESIRTSANFKSFLQQEYANGTPVTIWYVLATPESAIVNEPLAKIGDYADELRSEDAGVTIPTVKGSNTLTVGTDLAPSKIEISGER